MRTPTTARLGSRIGGRDRTGKQERDRTGERTEEEERTGNCPECGARARPTGEGGELVCAGCGLVVEEGGIDHGPEWRAYGSDERRRKSRVGAPVTQRLHDDGLTTAIDWRDADADGRALSDRRRGQVARLRRWHERIRTNEAGERNLQFALGEIGRMASALALPTPVREVASVLYRRALAEDLVRGRSIEGVATASLYAACRSEGLARSLDEITAVSRIERTRIGRTYRHLAGELDLELEPVDPREFVPRFRSALSLPEAVGQTAEEIIGRTAAEGLLSGKSPTGFAAGAIYIAGLLRDDRRTQKEVADATGVTSVTVRNHYRAQVEALGLSTGEGPAGGTDVLPDREEGLP
jgi:transcription initiation factor TFIIB